MKGNMVATPLPLLIIRSKVEKIAKKRLNVLQHYFSKNKNMSFGAVVPSAMIFIHLHEQIVCTNESLLCTVLSYLRYVEVLSSDGFYRCVVHVCIGE